MKIALHRRSGFTLMELIVVIGIIILLAGLTISTVFRLRENQVEKNSGETVRQIQIGLDQRTKAVGDNIRAQKPVPEVIKELTRTANGAHDPVRANALHMMLRLRQEFPQSFVEADPTRFRAAYNPGNNPQIAALLAPYQPKPLFALAIGSTANDNPDHEAAVLLFLILSQGQGGITFDPEKVGGVRVVTVGGVQHKVFADGWGNPISFRRWTDALDDPGVADELSQPPHADKYPNRADPEERLGIRFAGDWMSGSFAANTSNRQIALSLFIARGNVRPAFNQTVPVPQQTDINPFDRFNRGPFIFSAGKDGQYGTPDDLYGFRLQQQGRGN